jgi:hypothetical protein
MNMSGANSAWIFTAESRMSLWISLYVARKCGGFSVAAAIMIVWKGEEGSAIEWDEDVDESEGESKTGWRIED